MFAFNIPAAASPASIIDNNHEIQAFMDLDKIESFPPTQLPAEEAREMHKFDKRLEDVLCRLQELRAEVKSLARQRVCDRNNAYIQDCVDVSKEAYTQLTSETHEQYGEDVEAIFTEEGLNPEAKHHNIAVYCGRKMKKAMSGRFNRRLTAAADIRDKRIAKLDRAMELMDKHRALTTLAQAESDWNPFFVRGGILQGHVWSDGIFETQVAKLEKGVYQIRFMWTAEIKALWRPVKLFVTRKIDGRCELEIRWAHHEKRRWHDFPLDIIVKDELMCEES